MAVDSWTERPVEILHVEDNLGDIKLAEIAFSGLTVPTRVSVVMDGDQALNFLKREGDYVEAPRPDLILMDLNIPKLDGREVLKEIKRDRELRRIPVIVLTSSEAEQDINISYDLQASCYIRKSESLEQFLEVFQNIEKFWFRTARLPGAAELA